MCSCIHAFMRSCVHAFTDSCNHGFTQLWIHWFIHHGFTHHTFIHSFIIHSFMDSGIHECRYLWIHLFMHSWTHSFIHSFRQSCTHSFIRVIFPKWRSLKGKGAQKLKRDLHKSLARSKEIPKDFLTESKQSKITEVSAKGKGFWR